MFALFLSVLLLPLPPLFGRAPAGRQQPELTKKGLPLLRTRQLVEAVVPYRQTVPTSRDWHSANIAAESVLDLIRTGQEACKEVIGTTDTPEHRTAISQNPLAA